MSSCRLKYTITATPILNEEQPKVSMVKLTKTQQKNHKEAFDLNTDTEVFIFP